MLSKETTGLIMDYIKFKLKTESPIQVVGWTIKQGRVQQDFKKSVILPGLFYTARLVPNSWGSYKAIIGALTIRVQGTNETYTLSFEDPFHDYVNKGYKGYLEQGSHTNNAISSLKNNRTKDQGWENINSLNKMVEEKLYSHLMEENEIIFDLDMIDWIFILLFQNQTVCSIKFT